MNINDSVWVKLTPFGRTVLRKMWADIPGLDMTECDIKEHYHYKHGWYEFQL